MREAGQLSLVPKENSNLKETVAIEKEEIDGNNIGVILAVILIVKKKILEFI